MNTKIFIEINSNNDFVNSLANYAYNTLINAGYNVTLLDNTISRSEKINLINSVNDSIVISNQINNEGAFTEIVYALKDTDKLATLIEDELSNYTNVLKFYQLRLPGNTSFDYNQIIRETPNSETIVINYNENDLNNPNNNWQRMAQSIIDGLENYITNKNIYIVVSGDSLYSIAQKFNITVNELKEANDLVSNNLSVGQQLIIPQSKEDNNDQNGTSENITLYTVKNGDSLYAIARNFNTTVDEIKRLNNITNNNLAIGQILKIPNDTNNSDNIINTNTYIVKSGDSLYSIARKFDTTVDILKRLNNLTSNTLSIGTTLIIPSSSPSNFNYTVESGDSLYSIARRFNTTVNAISNLNNLTTNLLSIGQVLKIPSNENNNNSTLITYTVQKGDSLYSIARKYNTSVDNLKNLNNLTNNNLTIGQVLTISR